MVGKKFAYEGFKERAEVSEWLSAVLEEDVVIMRAAQNRLTPLEDKQSTLINSQATDVRSGFMIAASLHLINIKSVRDLKEKIAKKYMERTSENGESVTLNDFDYEIFRPNIVIDYDTPYVEEEIM